MVSFDTRNNGIRFARESLDLIFSYYNLNNRDEAKIYFTDLKIMLSPGESITSGEVIDENLAEELNILDPSMTDLLCSYLEKEIAFFVEVKRASKSLEDVPFSEVWDIMSQNSYIDEYE